MTKSLDNKTLQMSQKSKKDFYTLIEAFKTNTNFSFIRFSDGETEILRNNRLHIGPEYVYSSAGTFKFKYPPHDFKEFNPSRDVNFRKELIDAAKFRSPNFIKGIRTKSNNNGVQDREMMIQFNSGSVSNLTFSDLLINSNYKKFRTDFLPLILNVNNVYLIANFRAVVTNANSNWTHIPIPDNFIPKYKQVLDEVMIRIIELPPGSVVLASASSLSNLIGYHLWKVRQDVTFIDIGTTIHDLVDMGSGNRSYHIVSEKLSRKNMISKARYILQKGYYLKW